MRTAPHRLGDQNGSFPAAYLSDRAYSEAESAFYQDLTRFILAGNAYASGLDRRGQSQVALVLIAMQKIASSPVAAVRAALRKRLSTIEDEVQRYHWLACAFPPVRRRC